MSDYISISKNVLVDYLNQIIKESVAHGGDIGGAYFTNEENLVNEMMRLGKWIGLTDYCIYNDSGTPQYGKTIVACASK